MIQQGTVREIDGDRIVVGCGRDGGCKSCSSTFCNAEDQTVFEVSNPNAFEVTPGDSVELYMDPGKTIVAGFMVLVVPLLLFAIGYVLVSRISESDALSAVAGLAGLGSGFGLSFLFSKMRKSDKLPEIRKILPPKLNRVQLD